MRKHYQKVVLLIALLTALAVLSGCTPSGNKTIESSDNSTVNATGNTKAAEPVKPSEPVKPVTITYMTKEHGSWPITQDTPVLKKIEELIGVKVEFIPLSQDSADQKINTVFASGDMPDCMNLRISKINEYGSKAFISLDDYIENKMPSIKKIADSNYKMSVVNSDGHIYGIPLYGINQINLGIVMRGDLLKKYNLEKPKTITDYENVLSIFKKGDPDSIPVGTQPSFKSTLLSTYSPAFGLHTDRMTAIDKKMVLNATTDNYKDLISWLSKLYAEGLLDQEYVVRSSASWEESIGLEKMTAFTGFYSRSDIFNNGVLKGKNAYMTCIPPLEGPKGSKGAPSYSKINTLYNTVITKSCKNVDAAVKYIDFIFSDEGRILTSWGIQGEHYTVDANGKHELIDKNVYTDLSAQAKIGIIQPMFPRYWDPELQYTSAGPMTREAIGFLEGLYIQPNPNLNYSSEASQEISEIWATLETYIDEYTHNVITGKDSINNWNDFQNNIKKYKGDRYMELVNEAYVQYLTKLEGMK